MKLLLKSMLSITLSLMCIFTCLGYALVSGNLIARGSAQMDAVYPDVYISNYAYYGEGVTVENIATSGTVLSAKLTGSDTVGLVTFWITVKNISDIYYVYERTIDGAEAGIDGVYSDTDIQYQMYDIRPMDPVNINGGERNFSVAITVPAGVTADNYILNFKFVERFSQPGEEFFPEDMPEQEVSLAQRLSDILNNQYPKINGKSSRDFLIEDTIQVRWEDGAPPYVGSMDKNYESQIDALFGDVMKDSNLSFILKNEFLNDDWYSEIALYSTSDPLDSSAQWGGEGVVCVYVTVFTPVIDSNWNIIGYTMVCEAVRGYCYEVRYGTDDPTPSFSTDEWKEDVGYRIGWNQELGAFDLAEIPDDALSADGTKLYKEDFDSYNLVYDLGGEKYYTAPIGNTIKQWLAGKIPPLW